jgi:hypothetical protein
MFHTYHPLYKIKSVYLSEALSPYVRSNHHPNHHRRNYTVTGTLHPENVSRSGAAKLT